ncbi:MAG: hypothetical protein ACP5MD_13325, partial [Verrucomicrobiia bacterium]
PEVSCGGGIRTAHSVSGASCTRGWNWYGGSMSRPNATQREARHLRNLAYQVAVELAVKPLDDSLRARAKALDSAIRAWDAAADRERIAAGKPLPGSVRPVARPARPHRALPLIAGLAGTAS